MFQIQSRSINQPRFACSCCGDLFVAGKRGDWRCLVMLLDWCPGPDVHRELVRLGVRICHRREHQALKNRASRMLTQTRTRRGRSLVLEVSKRPWSSIILAANSPEFRRQYLHTVLSLVRNIVVDQKETSRS
jgi:hypothetical protein